MENKTFEILLKEDTRYTVNTEKLDELEKLITITGNVLFSSYIFNNSLEKCHRKFLDMQCLLMYVLTAEHKLKQDSVTIKDFFDYCETRPIPPSALQEIQELIVVAITNDYLVPIKNFKIQESKNNE